MSSCVVNDFRTFRRDRGIDAQTSRQARLAPTYHLTNEMGVEAGIPEQLTEDLWSKVVFHLPSARVKSAQLLFYVDADSSTRDKPMRVLVNGHQRSHRQDRKRMLTGGWDRMNIPAGLLKEGENELIFCHHGVLHVDPGPGSASFRSFDGGKTWHTGALGADADREGEYMVRLRLKGYAPIGLLTSEVVDLADPEGKGVIAPKLSIASVTLEVGQTIPPGTAIDVEMRTGSTPTFDPRQWTPWKDGMRIGRPQRFVQWRATLSTERADRTPVLQEVTLKASVKTDGRALRGVSLEKLDHPELVRSSYEFTYLRPHPRVTRLLKQYRLEEMIAAGKSELERFALLRDWIHSQWLGWQSDKYPYTPPWDPLEILETTKGNWGYGMCTHYGAMFAGCAAALGYVSRAVVIDHHCVAEVWSEELQKWILQDAGPAREFDATYEVDGVPISALELHRYLARGQLDKVMANKLPQGTSEPMALYGDSFRRFGLAPRNDHLVYAEPAELHHGANQYHWDGYLWWTDRIDPKYPEYTLQTSRVGDAYWSVNQTRIYLAATGETGVLQVDLDTVTPNFDHYLVRFDDGEWEPRQAPLSWKLQAGGNALAVRGVNAFGRAGRISTARVFLEEG